MLCETVHCYLCLAGFTVTNSQVLLSISRDPRSCEAMEEVVVEVIEKIHILSIPHSCVKVGKEKRDISNVKTPRDNSNKDDI